MKRYERRLGVKKSPKAEADRRYYAKNRDRILAQAKLRAQQRRAESLPKPEVVETESSESSKPTQKAPSLFKQWIQRLTGTKDQSIDHLSED